MEVHSVTKNGKIILRNKNNKATYTVNRSFGHINHAHCITSYGSQGKTVDEVFISQPAGTFMATNAKQFYVSFSRARDRARVYTDDKEALLHYARELGERQSAIEVVMFDRRKIRLRRCVHLCLQSFFQAVYKILRVN